MMRRFSIVVDPSNASPLYIGGDAEKAKQLIKQRKKNGEPVAGWINVRPEKRFVPPITKLRVYEKPEIDIPEDDEDELDIASLKEIASGDGRKPEVKEAREKLSRLGLS